MRIVEGNMIIVNASSNSVVTGASMISNDRDGLGMTNMGVGNLLACGGTEMGGTGTNTCEM